MAARRARSAAFSAMTPSWELASRARGFATGATVPTASEYLTYVSIDDDDTRLDRDEVDADERHTHPRVDHDSFVEDAIENVDEACSAGSAFNAHVRLPGSEAAPLHLVPTALRWIAHNRYSPVFARVRPCSPVFAVFAVFACSPCSRVRVFARLAWSGQAARTPPGRWARIVLEMNLSHSARS